MSFLEDACAAARERVAQARAEVPLTELRERAAARPAPLSLLEALTAPGLSVIAEVKRSSPSRGRMAEIPDPAGLAKAYEAGGAAAISVLTEPRWFDGSLADLTTVAEAVSVPVLRKDFVVDAYQVWEARAAGAAAVLLIVAALSDAHLSGFLRTADDAGMDALVEVHDADEAARAVKAWTYAGTGRHLILGVNARDLTSLQVDPERFAAVRAALPDSAVAVAESGVRGPESVRHLPGLGAQAVLVGEYVATHDDPEAAVRGLVEAGA
ncbi:MAG TPA: indole-3-glycerol phosphate synthase TrpC [Candidatus Thermoplasmatota archaeon]|nr:indole-3-glycerol phosphate synthase TrpC [Candidatus Thermoplasmatota archaeon]HET6399699.1 indole-3-glycerol phosphate synthase TrpC [Candidatus Thermoplasmatota archaeon]